MTVKNVVIVAGGKNSRFREMSIFPKLLLPINPVDSILTHDMKLFRKQNVTILVNQDYYQMTKDYVANLGLKCNVVESTCTKGSATSIFSALAELPKENVLFIWSDLILSKDAIEDFMEKIKDVDDLVYGTYTLDYRLGVDKSGSALGDQHNLPGIYYARDLNKLFDGFKVGSEEVDLAELFERTLTSHRAVPYEGQILEFRDKKTFLDFYKDPFQKVSPTARFFNQISVNGDTLIKKCINKNYDKLIEREALWYEELENEGLSAIAPKFYSFDSENHIMKIEYIKGKPVFDALNYENLSQVMESIHKNLEQLHSIKAASVSEEDFIDSMRDELYVKPLERCKKVKNMLINYDEGALISLLSEAWNYIKDNADKEACLVHGDLNMSNMILSDEGEVKFIDPRGYFGKLKLYGSADYDYSKVLYALSGFDKFNAANYIYYSDGVYDKPEDRTEFAPSWLNTKLNRVIVATIWISLTSYIGQDIYKANIAYEHGVMLLKKALED